MMQHNCPFYGCQFVWWGFSIVDGTPLQPWNLLGSSSSNQCALVFGSHSPCLLEVEGKPVTWQGCPRVAEVRLTPGTEGRG